MVEGDCEPVVRQVNGQYKVKEKRLEKYHKSVTLLKAGFDQFELEHIPREENKRADKLVNEAMNDKKSHGLEGIKP